MAQVVELHDEFVKGRKTRDGRPLPAGEMPRAEPVVTLVAPDAVDEFLGARSLSERTAHLRRLRDEGLLICHGHGRLYQYVRGQGIRTAYVFRAQAHDVPRIGRHATPDRKRHKSETGGSVGQIKTF